MFSKACKYAIKAMIYLSSRSDENLKIGLREIAEEIDSPEPFTAKIMQTLTKQQLVNSTKGPHGGFFIEAGAPEIKLIEVVKAIDGLQFVSGCGLGLKRCSETHPCPIHFEYSQIRDAMLNLLEQQSIQSLANELQAGNSVLKQHLD
jgi:Rrf2 family protein